jgi:hypothetical protein
MWTCDFCGREYEKLYDARWNCPCRSDPEAAKARKARAIRTLGRFTVRIPMGIVIGSAVGPAIFHFAELPVVDGIGFGAVVGFFVGVLWGLSVLSATNYLFERSE